MLYEVRKVGKHFYNVYINHSLVLKNITQQDAKDIEQSLLANKQRYIKNY